MASLFSKAKSILLGPDYDDEEYLEEEFDEEQAAEPHKEAPTARATNKRGMPSKVVNIHQVAKMEVVRAYPEVIGDAFSICEYVKDNKICVVNLEGVENKEAQRIADFLGGAAFALNGDIQRISKTVFIIAPTSVEITGQLRDELKENGFNFPWLNSGLR
ncbi:MAG: cell division protein SepF [Clostridiales bacterium]|jgi:cell division inhibitor SepF|nr:cell division protein SepF [Clostridiales bacterium]